MKTAIIIINWNGAKDTLACLQSLESVVSSQVRVIVVDNGSAPNDLALLKTSKPSFAELISLNSNHGFTGANNLGIQAAALDTDIKYFVLLNNDTTVDRDFLTAMIDQAERSARVGIVGPKILHADEPHHIQTVGDQLTADHRMSSLGANEPDNGQYDQSASREFVTGAALLIKRQTIDHIGLLDEDFFAYWEDADWCQRARTADWEVVYCPTAKVWHRHAASTQGRPWFATYLYTRNRYFFFRKHPECTVSRWTLLGQDLKTLPFLYRVNRQRPGTWRGVIRGITQGFFGTLHQPTQLTTNMTKV